MFTRRSLAEQDMQRRKTLRSLPSRKPYFDRNDVSRIVNFVEPRFLDLASRFSRFGSDEPPPRHVTHHCFFPYLKNTKYPEQKPTLMLFMRTIKDIDLGRAKRYLEYLGFDEVFVQNFLESQKTCIPDIAGTNKNLWSDETYFSLWFFYLYDLSGEELKQRLTLYDTKKWDQRLVKCNATWESLRITRGAAATVTGALFKKHFPSHKISLSSWIKKFQRWEAVVQSRAKKSKGREGRKRNGSPVP